MKSVRLMAMTYRYTETGETDMQTKALTHFFVQYVRGQSLIQVYIRGNPSSEIK